MDKFLDKIVLKPKIVKENISRYRYIGEIDNKEQEDSDDFYVYEDTPVDMMYLDVYVNGLEVSKNYSVDILSFFVHLNKTTKYLYSKEIKKEYRYSEFFPITCTCGWAGCADICDGVHIKRNKRFVKWNLIHGYERIFKKSSLIFDRQLYEKELKSLWSFISNNKDTVYYSETRTIAVALNDFFILYDGRNGDVNLSENIKYISRLKF